MAAQAELKALREYLPKVSKRRVSSSPRGLCGVDEVLNYPFCQSTIMSIRGRRKLTKSLKEGVTLGYDGLT
jgi:hypothetical protein